MLRAFISVAAALAACSALADQPPDPAEITKRIDAEMRAEAGHCDQAANALETASCLADRRDLLDQQLQALVDLALAGTHESGNIATEEQRQKIRDAENAWKEYRAKHCWFDYVPHQRVNASSRQVHALSCEIRHALERMHEIRIYYLYDWR